ncbi:Scr1 family TA system antitoxin-like transcriptional regulator [Amycolatopsis sp. cmx-4-68]|uniref:Scr1 family TA system antitoxin-like transcriptional regulator n=1 Tax=Amycolatopsis sp. cmx-4-68 TaxID=2790938 RepID=UPI00397AF45C
MRLQIRYPRTPRCVSHRQRHCPAHPEPSSPRRLPRIRRRPLPRPRGSLLALRTPRHPHPPVGTHAHLRPAAYPAHDLQLLNHQFADTDRADAQSLAKPTRRTDLADENRQYTFLVGDTALRTCPPQLRADQLDSLKHRTTQANITLRVVRPVCAHLD